MIGKWNKSVILSYIGLSISILGIFLLFKGYDIKYSLICLIVSGICDLFDGTVARRCKRDESEKQFGIELDALIDVFVFIAYPMIILLKLGIDNWYYIPVFILYGIFGIARLAYFNITEEDQPRKYYDGLPTTYAAVLFPIVYLLSYFIDKSLFNIIYLITMFIISILFILKIKIPKPRKISSIVFILLAIIVISLYLFVL